MLPLSFAEYMQVFPGVDPSKKYMDYLEQSGFPQTLEFQNNKQLIRDYLDGMYNTIIRRDVLLRKDMKDSSQFDNITRFLFDNIGSEVSVNKIFNTLKNELKSPVQPPVINDYLDALVESYVFYKVPRWDIKGRKYLKTNAKYYTVDPALRYTLLGREGTDAGHILENVVYLELLRRGYRVSVGIVSGVEVDFYAEKDGGIEYYQVAQSVLDENTLLRELAPFQIINDNYPKILLTRDYDSNNYKGIQHINVLEWLLSQCK
jgi:hypothetical protein